MDANKLATISITLCLIAGSRSALAWQEVRPLPDVAPPATLQSALPPDSLPEYTAASVYAPYWPSIDPDHPMYDTSLIPRWSRRYSYEAAAGVPPDRAWWTPSAITGQLLWLNRTEADPSVLLTGGVLNPLTLTVDHSPAVTISDLELPVEAAVRMSVLLARAGPWQPELAYLGVFDQNASVNYAPIGSSGVIETTVQFFDLALTSPVTDLIVSYESDLHSAEYNMWYDDGWRFQSLVGFRWIQQMEEFEQFETQNTANRNFAEVTNNLLGGQIGFRTYLLERGKLSIFAIAKAGLFYNQTRLLADAQNGGVVLGSLDHTEETTSFAGELNLTANWQLTPYMNVHIGYTGLWLAEVGLVGDQLNDFTFAGGGSVDYGGVSYQGGHLGVTFAW